MTENNYDSRKAKELEAARSKDESKTSPNKLTNEEKKKEQEKIWGELIGDDKQWSEFTFTEKFTRILLNMSKVSTVLMLLYFFVCSLDLLSSSFRLIAGKSTGAVMNNEYISNPIVGLMIGILVTVLVQSSSTSTSIIVSMVAANILKVHEAIPMILGSNIGTSVTNTIVSFTQVADREQFRRAFAGATVHDMFNWLAVTTILIVEVSTGMLENLTSAIVSSISGLKGTKVKLLNVITEPFSELIIQLDTSIVKCWGMGFKLNEETMIKQFCSYVPYANFTNISTILHPEMDFPEENFSKTFFNVSSSAIQIPEKCKPKLDEFGLRNCNFLFYGTSLSDSTIGIILLFVSLTILCSSLVFIVKILNSVLKGSIAKVIKKVINSDIPYVPWLTGYVALMIGAVMTFIVQSSSVFTSTLTPLIGMGIISVDRAYPLTLGSNIGTTTTALLAALAADGDKSDSIQIALVHLFFNVIGIMIFYPIPFMRWPIPLCQALGRITARYRWFAVLYLIVMFFLLPGSIFALSLGGPVVLWGVLGPLITMIVFIILINVTQSRKPEILPVVLQSWEFLPEPMRSLDPYDRFLTSLPCCTKCQNLPEEGIDEVVVHRDQGHVNPLEIKDS